MLLEFIAFAIAILFIKSIRQRSKEKHIFVILGSGGHTSEMFRMLAPIQFSDCMKLVFIAGNDDILSRQRAEEFKKWTSKDFLYASIQRPRRVHQKSVFAIFNSLIGFFQSIYLYALYAPKAVLCNGPGIAFIISLVAYLMRPVIGKTRIIYVESFARVYTLSTTGKLIEFITDEFYVQWPDISSKGSMLKCARVYQGHPFV